MAREERAYYRNAKGEVECPMIAHPGTNCGHQCGPECPVIITMFAAQDIEENNLERAERALTDVLRKVPDYTMASELLGTLYRRQHKFSMAQQVYYRAYQLDENNKDTLFGLILSYIGLENYDESQKYLDEYIQRYGRDNNVQALGNYLIEKVTKNLKVVDPKMPESVADVTADQILSKLIHYAAQKGILMKASMPMIPELWDRSGGVVNALFQGVLRTYQSDLEPSAIHTILLGFSMYAGMGAVVLWDDDWPTLRGYGIYNSLIKGKNLSAMDEYVTELVGYSYHSEKGQKLMRDLRSMIPVAEKAANYKTSDETPRNTPQLHECMKALFCFGAVKEMQRLGML